MFRLKYGTDKYLYTLNPTDVEQALRSEGIPTNIISECNSFKVRHGKEPNTLTCLLRHHSTESNLKIGLLGEPNGSSGSGILSGYGKVDLEFYDEQSSTEAFPAKYNFTYNHLYQTGLVYLLNMPERKGKDGNVTTQIVFDELQLGYNRNSIPDNAVVMATFKDVRHYMAIGGPPSKGFNILRHAPQCSTITPYYTSSSPAGYGDTYYTGTLRTDGNTWSFLQIVQWLLNDFNSKFSKLRNSLTTGNDSYTIQYGMDGQTSTTLTTLSTPVNFWTTGKTYLQCLVDLCQHYRLYFYVDENGTLIIGNHTSVTKDMADLSFTTEERKHTYNSITSDAQNRLTLRNGSGSSRKYVGNEHFINGPETASVVTPPHPLLGPTTESSTNNWCMNLTYPYSHSFIEYTSDTIATATLRRPANSTHGTDDASLPSGFNSVFNVPNPGMHFVKRHILLKPCFGRDTIDYTQMSIPSTVVQCIDPRKHSLNYINPQVEWYYRNSNKLRLWYARRTSTAGSYILYYSPTQSTGVTVAITDSMGIFSDMVEGDLSIVLEQGGTYIPVSVGCDPYNVSAANCSTATGAGYISSPTYPSV